MKASDITRADIVCVIHDHSDHLGDAIDICKRTGATFVGVYELGTYAQAQGVTDVVAMNIEGNLGGERYQYNDGSGFPLG